MEHCWAIAKAKLQFYNMNFSWALCVCVWFLHWAFISAVWLGTGKVDGQSDSQVRIGIQVCGSIRAAFRLVTDNGSGWVRSLWAKLVGGIGCVVGNSCKALKWSNAFVCDVGVWLLWNRDQQISTTASQWDKGRKGEKIFYEAVDTMLYI